MLRWVVAVKPRIALRFLQSKPSSAPSGSRNLRMRPLPYRDSALLFERGLELFCIQ